MEIYLYHRNLFFMDFMTFHKHFESRKFLDIIIQNQLVHHIYYRRTSNHVCKLVSQNDGQKHLKSVKAGLDVYYVFH